MGHYLLGNKGAHLYNGNIQCQRCDKNYTTPNRLAIHMCTHCDDCSKTYSTYQRFKAHKCTAHDNSTTPVSQPFINTETQQHSCIYCLKSYASIYNLNKHKCVHCKNCTLTFTSYKKLTNHVCIVKTKTHLSSVATTTTAMSRVGTTTAASTLGTTTATSTLGTTTAASTLGTTTTATSRVGTTTAASTLGTTTAASTLGTTTAASTLGTTTTAASRVGTTTAVSIVGTTTAMSRVGTTTAASRVGITTTATSRVGTTTAASRVGTRTTATSRVGTTTTTAASTLGTTTTAASTVGTTTAASRVGTTTTTAVSSLGTTTTATSTLGTTTAASTLGTTTTAASTLGTTTTATSRVGTTTTATSRVGTTTAASTLGTTTTATSRVGTTTAASRVGTTTTAVSSLGTTTTAMSRVGTTTASSTLGTTTTATSRVGTTTTAASRVGTTTTAASRVGTTTTAASRVGTTTTAASRVGTTTTATSRVGTTTAAASIGHKNFSYQPVDFQWQLNMCNRLGLALHSAVSLQTTTAILHPPSSVHKIRGDGNCFFRSISYVITGSPDYHSNIRQRVVQHLINKQTLMFPVLDTRSARAYLHQTEMAKIGKWATQVEIYATAHLLNTDIYIYSQFGKNLTWLKHSGQFVENTLKLLDKAIYIQHTNLDHYEVVTSVLPPLSTVRTTVPTSTVRAATTTVPVPTVRATTTTVPVSTVRASTTTVPVSTVRAPTTVPVSTVRAPTTIVPVSTVRATTTVPVSTVITKTTNPIFTVGTTPAPRHTVKSAIPVSTVKSAAPVSTMKSTLPVSTVKSAASVSTVKSAIPVSTVKSAAPVSTMKSTMPLSTVKSTTPVSTVKSTTPVSTVKSTLPVSTVKSAASVSTVKSAIHVSTVKSAAPVSTMKSTTPVSTVKSTLPLSTVKSAGSVSTVKSAGSVSTVKSAGSVSTVKSTTPVSTVKSAAPVSTVKSATDAVGSLTRSALFKEIQHQILLSECVVRKNALLHSHGNNISSTSNTIQNLSRRQRDKQRKQLLRQAPLYREKENKLKRHTPQQRQKEKVHKQEKRQSPEQREKEKLHKQEKRQRPEQREKENERKRHKPQQRQKEKVHKQEKRQRPEHREKENERKRHKPQQRQKEKVNKQEKRQRPEQREKENERKRHKPQQRQKEKVHKQEKRQRPEQREKEREHKKQRRQSKCLTEDDMITQFHKAVEQGPVYTCTCCHQMWYRNGVRLAHNNFEKGTLFDKCFTATLSNDEHEWICMTCHSAITKRKLPPLSIANKMAFPEIPSSLELTKLEERLVAPRIPFMQLHELPRGGQISIHGNVVNVPTNVNTTVTVLPRKHDDSASVPIKLKRKLSYKHHYLYQSVRPHKVMEAVKYLVHTSDVYKEEGITIDESWDYEELDDATGNTLESDSVQPIDDCDKEQLDNCTAGNLDTLLVPQDITDEARQIISVAPGEGNTPLSIFMDTNSEILSFPTLFCGQPRPDNTQRDVNVHYSDICKSELRRVDRRVAGHIPNLFFKLKKLQKKHIMDKVNLCLRRTKNTKDVTAGVLKSPDRLEQIVKVNDGYRIFKDLRGSPPYWEKVKKDLFAIIRQLGIPTWFASFSAAETRWDHLLQILGMSVHHKCYTSQEVEALSWFDKQELIQKDPVTCARHFDYQVQKLIHTVLKHVVHPVGKIVDYFYKVEFQMRGSPHIHMLQWVENAPVLNESAESEKDVTEFIDKYVSCKNSPEMEDLVKRQSHIHSRTCQMKSRNRCRFNYPQPPLKQTLILDPLPEDISNKEKEELKKKWRSIQEYLDKTKENEDFESFLLKQNLTEHEYLLAIRSSIKTKTVFLQREVQDTKVNNYNRTLLKAWRANMDQQFILDPFACATYIVAYITKSQRGMSNLLYDAAKEAREGKSSVKDQVKMIGNKFLNNVEISSQEAVYNILQIPLYKSSRDVIFINTGVPEERTIMLKSFQQLQALPDDSTDVQVDGMLQHYAHRPSQLQQMCLADFASWYRRVKKGSSEKVGDDNEGDSESDSDSSVEGDNDEWQQCYSLGKGYQLKRKSVRSVIRYVSYHVDDDAENHYRVQLMLFHPWRNENEIIGECSSYQEQYLHVTNISPSLAMKAAEYNHHSEEIEQAESNVRHMQDNDLEENWDAIAPNTQHIEQQDADEGTRPTDLFPLFEPQENAHSVADIGLELGVAASTSAGSDDVVVHMMPEEKYIHLLQSLNIEQRHFFYHILTCMKTRTEPFHIFLTGGAGVGKSVVITAIFQALLRFLNKGPEVNPDELKVLLGAPTGKAAYLINGNTLHHLFAIPASQGFAYKPLSHEKLNTLRCKFHSVKLLIIDEVSMVGNKMFAFIQQRLQQIMGCGKPFGGISVLAVGDLYQLKPVFDGWIFQNLTKDYGPLATNLWTEYFVFYQLNEIMRQSEDGVFAELLNRLRVGQHTQGDISILNTCLIKKPVTDPDYPLHLQHIFLTNDMVHKHNRMVFQLAPADKRIEIHAWDLVVGDVSKEIKEKVKQSIPADCTKTMGLIALLQTAVGLKVELSTNVDVEDGLANGASGTIVAITSKSGANRPTYIWIEFEDTKVGKNLRQKSSHLYSSGLSMKWTPVPEVKRQFKVGRYRSIEVLRSQFPLRPAAAKTAHRCQGDTMEGCVVDLSGRAFPHSHYVVLSRAKNKSNLHIKNLNESAIKVTKDVHIEMQRLQSNKSLELCYTGLPDDTCSPLKIIFHNVRSLHKHLGDILHEPYYRSAHILLFAETKLSNKNQCDNYNIPGYLMKRFDFQTSNQSRSDYGLVVYHRVDIADNVYHYQKTTAKGKAIEFVILPVTSIPGNGNTSVVMWYSSPQTNQSDLKTAIDDLLFQIQLQGSCPTIIMGDFNVDLLKTEYCPIIRYLVSYKQLVKSVTTDHYSLLDHIYTNIPTHKLDTSVLECYFSDHKAICLAVAEHEQNTVP